MGGAITGAGLLFICVVCSMFLLFFFNNMLDLSGIKDDAMLQHSPDLAAIYFDCYFPFFSESIYLYFSFEKLAIIFKQSTRSSVTPENSFAYFITAPMSNIFVAPLSRTARYARNLFFVTIVFAGLRISSGIRY